MPAWSSTSIRWKLARAILASVVVATFLVTIGSALRETTRQLHDQRQAVVAIASTLATSISAPVERGEIAEIGARLNAIRAMPGITFAIVVDGSGRRLYEFGSGVVIGAQAEPLVPNQELSLIGSLRLSTYLVSAPVVSGGRNVGQLSLIADITNLRAALAHSIANAILSGLAAAVFGMLLSMRLRKSIVDPILHLAHAAEAVRTTGDYSRTVAATSTDETGRLVECFNAMMREIHARDGEIKAQRDGLVETVRERTHELCLARDAAERANAAKSDFLATMSHEIRTPMNAMLVMTELLATDDLSEAAQRRCKVILKSGQVLLSLINDILDLSKIEAGQLVLEEANLDPRALVEDVGRLFADRAAVAGLELSCVVADEVPSSIVGDPLRLQQVMSNLVNNALKFTETGGVRISVDVSAGDAAPRLLRISVHDTGGGIAADQIKSIFEAFAQADASTSRKYGGTGIGLTICQRLASAMGGTIEVESVLGQGSTFTLAFPLRLGAADGNPAAAGEGSRARAPASSTRSFKGLRVLAADDNEANREVLASALARFGVVVTLVETGADAIAAHQREPYDLIFMDGNMPVLDGFEATRRIRTWEGPTRTPVPIVALTALVRYGGVDQWREAGMSDCIVKPFKLAEIGRALEKWVGDHAVPTVDGASGAALEEQATGGETSPLIDDAVLRNIARIGSDGGALLARICQLYCQQAPKLLSDLRDVAGHGELSDAAHAAHALKSLCLNVGALRAGNLCDAIETAAAGGDAIPPAMISCVTETIDATVRALPGAAERIKSALAPPVRAVA